MATINVISDKGAIAQFISERGLQAGLTPVQPDFIIDLDRPLKGEGHLDEIIKDIELGRFPDRLPDKPPIILPPPLKIVQDYAADRDALKAIYVAANGKRWARRYGWCDPDVPMSEWEGVTVEPKIMIVFSRPFRRILIGRVTALSLSHNNMYCGYLEDNGRLSPEIGKLTELRYLHLGYNFLQGTIPDELYKLTKLEYLYLHFNQFSGGISTAIGKLKNLRELQLDHNRLTGAIPKEIGNLASLERLLLHENGLDNGLLRLVRPLTSKKELAVVELQELQELLLKRIETPIPAEIAALAALRVFYAYGNQLSGTLPAAIATRCLREPEWKLTEQQDGVTLKLPTVKPLG